jgi:hypothetical protein
MTQSLILIMALATAAMTALAFYYNNWIKFFVIVIVVILANMIYFTFDGVKGWPAVEHREVKGTLASVIIINPSQLSKGAIIISLFPTEEEKWYEYQYPNYAPKTYYLEYSNDRAAEFQKARQAIMEGKEVRINAIPELESGEGSEGDGAETNSIGEVLRMLLPSLNDTYKPKVPDIEVMRQEPPPEKESN